MARTKRQRSLWLVGILGLVGLAIMAVFFLVERPHPPVYGLLVRGAGMLGYLAIFLAIVSAQYMRELVRFFGRAFVKVHHAVAISGLVLITLHPVVVAINANTLSVFLPSFQSFRLFWVLAGRPAWYLLVLGSLAAVLRGRLGSGWRIVHALNYLAFIMGTVHGILLGTDMRYTVVRVVAIGLALSATAVFALKRLDERAGARRTRQRASTVRRPEGESQGRRPRDP